MAEIIFYVADVLVLFAIAQLLKNVFKTFYEKVKKFVPIGLGALSSIAMIVFSLVSGKMAISFSSISNCVGLGFLIASAEVFTYEGVYKLLKDVAGLFSKSKAIEEK